MKKPRLNGFATSEQAVLVLGTRSNLSTDESLRLRQLVNEELDWRAMLESANCHQVLALLLTNLTRENCLPSMPRRVCQSLRAAVHERAARSLALTQELVRILDLLERSDVPAIPCKGPVVALMAYGSVSLRSFADLDILVPETHLHLAREALQSMGYRSVVSLNTKQERAFLQNECALQLKDEARGLVVELHWRFCERNASIDLPVADFWRRSVRVSLAGTEVLTLAGEDLLLYLCVHGAKHRWERLEWITCVAALVRWNQFDWGSVILRAEGFAIARIVRVGLMLAQVVGGAQIPSSVCTWVDSDGTAQKLTERILADLFSPVADQSHYHRRASRYLFMMRCRERWSDRARIFFYSAIRPPHPDADEWAYLPGKLAFLHRVFRPVRLFAEYSWVAWRHYLR